MSFGFCGNNLVISQSLSHSLSLSFRDRYNFSLHKKGPKKLIFALPDTNI